MKLRAAYLAASLLVPTQAIALDGTYLCIGDLATGFFMSGDTWKTTTFNTAGDRFAVVISGIDVSVTRIGENSPTYTCSLYSPDSNQFACGGLGYGFVMNFDSLRYQEYYGVGYVSGSDTGRDTPNITIGKCSPL